MKNVFICIQLRCSLHNIVLTRHFGWQKTIIDVLIERNTINMKVLRVTAKLVLFACINEMTKHYKIAS